MRLILASMRDNCGCAVGPRLLKVVEHGCLLCPVLCLDWWRRGAEGGVHTEHVRQLLFQLLTPVADWHRPINVFALTGPEPGSHRIVHRGPPLNVEAS